MVLAGIFALIFPHGFDGFTETSSSATATTTATAAAATTTATTNVGLKHLVGFQ